MTAAPAYPVIMDTDGIHAAAFLEIPTAFRPAHAALRPACAPVGPPPGVRVAPLTATVPIPVPTPEAVEALPDVTMTDERARELLGVDETADATAVRAARLRRMYTSSPNLVSLHAAALLLRRLGAESPPRVYEVAFHPYPVASCE